LRPHFNQPQHTDLGKHAKAFRPGKSQFEIIAARKSIAHLHYILRISAFWGRTACILLRQGQVFSPHSASAPFSALVTQGKQMLTEKRGIDRARGSGAHAEFSGPTWGNCFDGESDMKIFVLGASAAVSLLTATPAMAAFVVDTGAPTDLAKPNFTVGPSQSLAGLFTLGAATTIDTAQGFINSNGTGTITVTIYSNGAVPDANNILYSASVASSVTGLPGAWQGVSGQSWALAAGTYWIGFASTEIGGMYNGAPNPLSAYAFTSNGTWFQNPLDIGVRLAGGAVPEPTSWAMMITGFGFVGGAMRRRATKIGYA
jgi:hypothetical protein